ncbi:unnamed protein product [Allacma fusca]|uniref:Tektin n=1 Tax=Allacma fusca TaxID=39272 RepID=A0A8J2JDW5_9HEXA|nr:unnamed protein product [Allacma fusca]
MMKEADTNACVPPDAENQFRCADDSSKEIERKLNDIRKWKRNQKKELQYNITQTHELLKLRETVEAMVKELQEPLNITQENIYARESRPVQVSERDAVGESLLTELENLRRCDETLTEYTGKLTEQLTKLRMARQELETDIQSKREMKHSDDCVKLLCALSKEIGGLKIPENQAAAGKTISVSELNQNSLAVIQRSEVERDSARALHAQVNKLMLSCADQCFGIWYETNACLSSKIKEICTAIQHLQEQYRKSSLEIQAMNDRINVVRSSLDQKLPALKLTKAEAEKRTQTAGMELCQDKVAMKLLREMHTMQKAVDKLKSQLNELDETMRQLVKSNRLLEKDLRLKNMALFIHRQKCLNLRQNFPISTFKHAQYPACKIVHTTV